MKKWLNIDFLKKKETKCANQSTSSTSAEDNKKDVVSSVIGNYGRWQLLNTFLLAIFSFPSTIHIYLPTFTAIERKFWCRPPYELSNLSIDVWINYSQPVDACNVREISPEVTVESILNNTAPLIDSFVRCTEWDYDSSDVGNTIISEWDLVCDNAHLASLAEVVFLIGVGIGGVVGGWISDKFGRKRILMIMLLIQCILALLVWLVRSYVQYTIVRLLMGLVSVSVVFTAFVLSVELVGGKWVIIAGVGNFFPLPLAYVTVTLMSLAFPNWRDLQLAMVVPGCLLLVTWFVLPESPRWLLSTGKIQEAKAVLLKAAKFNKREIPVDLEKVLLADNGENKPKSASVLMLFNNELRLRFICLFLAWFAMTIAYYGLLLNIGNFNLGNLHVTSIILAVVEIPAIALSIPILLKGGRRIPIFLTMITCGLACLVSALLSEHVNIDWVTIGCLMIGKFAISSTNMMMPVFTAELYPIIIRNLGVGASQVAAGLALIGVPYLWLLATFYVHLPMFTIALLSVAGGLIVLLLPETAKSNIKSQPVGDNGT